jgi:hypothetical protein
MPVASAFACFVESIHLLWQMGVFDPSFVVSISLNLCPSGITLFFQEQIMFHTMGMFEHGTIENLSWQLYFQRYIYICIYIYSSFTIKQ